MRNGVKVLTMYYVDIEGCAYLVKVGESGFREKHVHLLLGLFRQTSVEKLTTEICKIKSSVGIEMNNFGYLITQRN